TNNLPVAGPVLQNILAEPAAQQAISPTLDTVAGLSDSIAEAGSPTLLDLRRLRLQELIKTNRQTVEGDGNGLPVRPGIVAMIDGGVASHPSLGRASIEQSGFAGAPKPTGHGTAVASLLVGSQGSFRGAATGARLLVADVYGGNRAAGSATSIVRALSWLSGK